MQLSGVTLSPGSQNNHYFFSPTDITQPSTTVAPHYAHTSPAASCCPVTVFTPSPIVCVTACQTMSPISFQSMIQRLWPLPIQEDQMVFLFDMRGGGVLPGTGVEAPKRALNTHVHTVVNLWMECSLSGHHCHGVSASSYLWILTSFFLPPMGSLGT